MLTILNGRGSSAGYCDGVSRRNFLKIGALGLGGGGLPPDARPRLPRRDDCLRLSLSRLNRLRAAATRVKEDDTAMLTILNGGGSSADYCDGFSRRNFLKIGALGLGGLTLPQLLRA